MENSSVVRTLTIRKQLSSRRLLEFIGLVAFWLLASCFIHATPAHAYVPLSPDPCSVISGCMPSSNRNNLEACYSGGPAETSWVAIAGNGSQTSANVPYNTPTTLNLQYFDAGSVCSSSDSVTDSAGKIYSATASIGSVSGIANTIRGYHYDCHNCSGQFRFASTPPAQSATFTWSLPAITTSGYYYVNLESAFINLFTNGQARCVPNQASTANIFAFDSCPRGVLSFPIYISVPSSGNVIGRRIDQSGNQLNGTGGQVSFDRSATGSCSQAGTGTQTGDQFWFSGPPGNGHCLSAQPTINVGGQNWSLIGYYYCVNCTNDNPRSYGSYTNLAGGNLKTDIAIVSGANSSVWWVYQPPPAPTCSPNTQTVGINQTATLTAGAGNGSFSWTASGGSPSSGSGSSFSTSWPSAGSKTVTVTSNGQPVNCTVIVKPVCTPNSQTVNANQSASFSVGGIGTFTWSASGGSPSSGSGNNFSTSYSSAGSYSVKVTSNGQTSNPCTVTVNNPPNLSCNVTTSPADPDPGNPFTTTVSLNNAPGAGTLSGASTTINIPPSSSYSGPSGTVTPGGSTSAVTPPMSRAAGSYNVTLLVSGGNTPGGSQNLNCGTINVANKPYFRVYGGDIAAGIGSCTGWTPAPVGSRIIAFNDSFGAGAGTQLAAFAMNTIDQFTSATGRTASPTPAKGLTFANTSGTYGGSFGPVNCPADYYSSANGATALPSTTIGSLNTGSYTATSGTVLNPSATSAIGDGKKVVIYISGNVVIQNSIMYQNAGTWTDISKIPSFYLVVKGGNIYIDSSVTQLDGVYIAQPTTATNGKIYTCATGTNPVAAANLYSTCNQKLTINGAFIARQIRFYRSGGVNGTIRNSSNTEAPTSSNIAEAFISTPELWLTTPAPFMNTIAAPYDSIASLPPVL